MGAAPAGVLSREVVGTRVYPVGAALPRPLGVRGPLRKLGFAKADIGFGRKSWRRMSGQEEPTARLKWNSVPTEVEHGALDALHACRAVGAAVRSNGWAGANAAGCVGSEACGRCVWEASAGSRWGWQFEACGQDVWWAGANAGGGVGAGPTHAVVRYKSIKSHETCSSPSRTYFGPLRRIDDSLRFEHACRRFSEVPVADEVECWERVEVDEGCRWGNWRMGMSWCEGGEGGEV
jgi:hypothetical protein